MDPKLVALKEQVVDLKETFLTTSLSAYRHIKEQGRLAEEYQKFAERYPRTAELIRNHEEYSFVRKLIPEIVEKIISLGLIRNSSEDHPIAFYYPVALEPYGLSLDYNLKFLNPTWLVYSQDAVTKSCLERVEERLGEDLTYEDKTKEAGSLLATLIVKVVTHQDFIDDLQVIAGSKWISLREFYEMELTQEQKDSLTSEISEEGYEQDFIDKTQDLNIDAIQGLMTLQRSTKLNNSDPTWALIEEAGEVYKRAESEMTLHTRQAQKRFALSYVAKYLASKPLRDNTPAAFLDCHSALCEKAKRKIGESEDLLHQLKENNAPNVFLSSQQTSIDKARYLLRCLVSEKRFLVDFYTR